MTKYFHKLCFLMIIFVPALMAHAQQTCVPAEYLQRNADQVFLIRLTQVEHQPMGGREYSAFRIDRRKGRFEVLKVYHGDVAFVHTMKDVTFEIHCGDNLGLDCSILEESKYPFQSGSLYIIYDSLKKEDQRLTMKLTSCPHIWRKVESTKALNDFEKMYPPIWQGSSSRPKEKIIDKSSLVRTQEKIILR